MNNMDELINKVDDKTKEEFLSTNKSTLNIKKDIKKVEYDYSWLEKIEECLSDLDAIVRHPKKFIMQEEEIVNVEKAKKLTLESVKHLATHTNFIQEYDPIEDKITPSKVLNINKEESYDIYENRFIYSLLMNLSMFIAKRKELSGAGSNSDINKIYNYSSTTQIGNEKVRIDLTMQSEAHDDLVGKDPSGLSLNERLDRVQLIVHDFMSSQFIKELAASNIIMVKSPIRKTNVILKNQNFQKALELWEFMERYNVTDKVEQNDQQDYEETGTVRKKMDELFLMDYIILNSESESVEENKKGTTLDPVYKSLKTYIDGLDEVKEKKFETLIKKEFKRITKDKKSRENKFEKLFEKEFKKYELDLKNSFKELVI